VLLRCTETMPTTVPPKKRKAASVEAAPAEEVAMTDDDLKEMSMPPERPSGQSSVVVPFPGGHGYHHYHCWCDACLGNLVKRWNEFHPDAVVVVLPEHRMKKPVVPYT